MSISLPTRPGSRRQAPADRPLAPLQGRQRLVGRGVGPLAGVDVVLLSAVVALLVLGTLLVWSATSERSDPTALVTRHVLNVVVAVVLGTVVAFLDSRALRTYAPLVYVASLVGLVAVLSPLGRNINGAHAWIVVGGLQVQPSEFAKVALVVGGALLLTEGRSGRSEPGFRELCQMLLLAAVPATLVLLQPDLGTVLVLLVIVLGLLLVSGVGARWIVGLLVAGVLVCGGAVAVGVLDEYQVERFSAFTNPDADPRGIGYNTAQARIAIGSGGLTGAGLFQGTQTSGEFVPEQQTDFIFTVAGEELGFLGAGALVLVLGLVLWRGIRIAYASPDLFGSLVAAGIVSWWAFQAFINIGMCLGIMPVTGLPLPFVSYGGSAMIANLMGVGLLLNIAARSRRTG